MEGTRVGYGTGYVIIYDLGLRARTGNHPNRYDAMEYTHDMVHEQTMSNIVP
jgi:hypothetical protein